jgi:hypothetical protein
MPERLGLHYNGRLPTSLIKSMTTKANSTQTPLTFVQSGAT